VDKTTTERLTISNIKVGICTGTPLPSRSLSTTQFSVQPLPCATLFPTSLLSSVSLLLPHLFRSGSKDCTFIPIKTVTIPVGTSVRAVVNINIDLQYLPYTASEGFTHVLSESLMECDKVVTAFTGYSILQGAEYLYRTYYSNSDVDINQSESIDHPSSSIISSSDSSSASGSGMKYPNSDRKEVGEGHSNTLKEEVEEEEKFVKCFHDEVSWFVPLRRGRTLLVTLLQVDLGPDIPSWAAETGVVSNALSKVLALQEIVKRKGWTGK
jgi:hypothetical protein